MSSKKKAQHGKKKLSTQNKQKILMVIGILSNIVLIIINTFSTLGLIDTSKRVSEYRRLQNNQIASVTELCFDVGVARDALKTSKSEDRIVLDVIFAIVLKDEYFQSYSTTFNNICYKPLLILSDQFIGDNEEIEKRASELLEDKTQGDVTDQLNNSKFSVKENAFDKVRW